MELLKRSLIRVLPESLSPYIFGVIVLFYAVFVGAFLLSLTQS